MTDTDTEPVLAAHQVHVTYHTPGGEVTALTEISLAVPATGITVLAGPSGSGKSTLLRVLGLIERPQRGSVHLRGQLVSDLPQRRLRRLRRTQVALVFQQPTHNLIDHLRVGDNLRAAAQSAGRDCDEQDLLDRMGLAGTATWTVTALSGGQQQRLAFGCALARQPAVILADEPTSQLDADSADLVLATLRNLARTHTPVVVASHDQRVIDLAQTVIRLHQGRLAPDEPTAPSEDQTR